MKLNPIEIEQYVLSYCRRHGINDPAAIDDFIGEGYLATIAFFGSDGELDKALERLRQQKYGGN